MFYCPCCSNKLLRHIRGPKIYWFCSTCRQEMPALEELIASRPSELRPLRSELVSGIPAG